MRISWLELSGFRGFPRPQTFDLDADAVVVVGANGTGKTSLFDGILWALSGRVPRLHENDARLVSMYSEAGQARVALRLVHPASGQVDITRSFDGNESRVTVTTGGREYHGPAAEGRLIELLFPFAASTSDTAEVLASVLTRSVYLQQDAIRHFIEAISEPERFAAVSELVGVGSIAELQAALEREKRAWTKATSQRAEQLQSRRERLAVIESNLAEMRGRASEGGQPIALGAWNEWWHGLARLGLKVGPPEPGSREAASAIDRAIKHLHGLRLSTERRLQVLKFLRAEITRLAGAAPVEVPLLRDRETELRKELEDLRRLVADEQEREANVRQLQAALKDKAAQLSTLARIALNHLEDRCPVCAQSYDREGTRSRLLELAKQGDSEDLNSDVTGKLRELRATLAAKEKRVTEVALAARAAEQLAAERRFADEDLSKRLNEVGILEIDPGRRAVAVDIAIAGVEHSLQQVATLEHGGESLALLLAQASALAAITEAQHEAERSRRELADLEKEITARNATGERAQDVIEALRESGTSVVRKRLLEIEPLLQAIYARIDPHPAFRTVTFLTRVFQGKGQLSTIVKDLVGEKESDLPALVLSSSQVNALAVSVFLALNIGVPRPPLSVAILDDPLQSLDDINLLGLVDLLRRAKDQRQLFVSTHDGRFGGLLARKLRPANDKGRTVIIELDHWSRGGPTVTTREVKGDPVPLRLVGAEAR